LNAKNNILDHIGRDGSIVASSPSDVIEFDRYARELAAANVDCLGKLLKFPDWYVQHYKTVFLESVGGYWAAKGEDFGRVDDAQDHGAGRSLDDAIRIKALCDSRAAYSHALDSATQGARATGTADLNKYDKLDLRLTEDDSSAYPLKIQTGRHRVLQELDAFPAADVASACK
jgi:hypothetical protein